MHSAPLIQPQWAFAHGGGWRGEPCCSPRCRPARTLGNDGRTKTVVRRRLSCWITPCAKRARVRHASHIYKRNEKHVWRHQPHIRIPVVDGTAQQREHCDAHEQHWRRRPPCRHGARCSCRNGRTVETREPPKEMERKKKKAERAERRSVREKERQVNVDLISESNNALLHLL